MGTDRKNCMRVHESRKRENEEKGRDSFTNVILKTLFTTDPLGDRSSST